MIKRTNVLTASAAASAGIIYLPCSDHCFSWFDANKSFPRKKDSSPLHQSMETMGPANQHTSNIPIIIKCKNVRESETKMLIWFICRSIIMYVWETMERKIKWQNQKFFFSFLGLVLGAIKSSATIYKIVRMSNGMD